MQTARRPIFVILSLLAMFALQLPATLWACPMMGGVGQATEICRNAMPVSASMPCAHLGGKCCRPFSVPPSTQTDDKQLPHAFTLAADFHSVPFVPLVVSASVVWAQAIPISIPEQTWIALSFHPPPRFASLFCPSALAGRAPPTL